MTTILQWFYQTDMLIASMYDRFVFHTDFISRRYVKWQQGIMDKLLAPEQGKYTILNNYERPSSRNVDTCI
jgi:hypothetical protein